MACRTGCATRDHATWGDCARASGIRVGWSNSAKGLDRTTEKNLQSELDAYARARAGGIQPDGTTRKKVEFAEKMSEQHGGTYGEEFRVMPNEKRTGFDAVFKKDEKALMGELKAMDHDVIRETATKHGIEV